MKYCLILILLMSASLLAGQSQREQRDYDYIYDLYNRQNDSEALLEIGQFITRYPQSTLFTSIRFMQAEILYYQGQFDASSRIYEELRYLDMEPEIKAELLYHYGISNYYLRDYNKALELFQVVSSEYDFDTYKVDSAIWMARIFSEGGQYYSAERNFTLALAAYTENVELKLELYSVYLSLNKTQEAEAILSGIDQSSPKFPLFLETLLSYYLNNELYQEFDAALRTYNVDPEQSRDQLRILIVRRLLLENWFSEAGHYLDNIAEPTDQSRYYDAILLKAQNNTTEADSIFGLLVRSTDSDIALLSYLERLKILFATSPQQAIVQLQAFLETNQGSEYLGELNYLLGYFYYQKSDYLPAIRHFSRSRNYEMNRYQADRIDAMTAECWFRLQRLEQAEERFNRYLNLYPQGLYRDRAWFNLGVVAFQKLDYNQSRIYFRNLATRHPNSALMQEARYYLAELDFYQANYNLAIQAYRSLLSQHPSDEGLMLRIAQSHFYNQNFSEALALADSISTPSYDLHLLKANCHFSLRSYALSLENFQAAYHLTEEPLKKKEAQSYVALTLYQMGRFTEASALYLQLSGEEANPDTYLFLAAKSAMQSGSERQAKELYERFLNLYPNSTHIQDAMADLATMDYNAGRFTESFTGWLNLLRRYNTKTGFTISERQTLRTTFTGIELCLNRSGSNDMAEALVEEIDRYNSDYIKFELQYILVKNYASRSLWQELLREAESIRQAADSSQKSQIELLMAESLINLNQYSAADSLLAGVFSATGSNDALLKRAEINLLEGNTQEALDLYLSSYQSTRNADAWVKVLECAELMEYQNYPDYLALGREYLLSQTQAVLIHLRYLLASTAYDELKSFADQVLDGEYSNYIHARAYLSIAEADYALADYQNSIRTQNRIKFLFPDIVDVQARVAYLNVYSLLRSGAVTEAQMSFWENRQSFTDEQIEELNRTFEGIR